MKACIKCGEMQPLDSFEDIKTKSGKAATCITCRNEQRRNARIKRSYFKIQDKEKKVSHRPILTGVENQQALFKLLPDLRNYARWTGGGMHFELYRLDAEDVLQESIIRMLASPTQPPVHELKFWAMRIIRNACVTAIRESTMVVSMDTLLYEPLPSPPDAFRELEDKMLSIIPTLKPKHRMMLEMRLEGLSYETIAKATGYTVGGLKSIIHEAKNALRKAMHNSPD